LKENHHGANRDWKINRPGHSSLEEKIKIERRKRAWETCGGLWINAVVDFLSIVVLPCLDY
jgi:hypothetical protein